MDKICNLNELIKSIPLIIGFMVPGYIFLEIKNFYTKNKREKDDNIILKSLIISFVINSITNIFLSENNYFFPIISIILAIVVSILYVKFIYSSHMEKTTHKFKLYKTFRKDVFDDVVDLELGIWMYIYLNDENIIYSGKLIYYENITEDNHRYIQLSNYSCYSYDGEEICNYVDDNCRTVLLNIKDVKRMELVYDDNSTKIKSS
ncbi:hypothetical protein FDB81_13485 [Clostridium sporogenes]|uniref:hypothetical protein n=1 Tax=Clostridium sporogenes TaxID=1509 RepID=UPI0007E1BF10|nr:hypothetical protein [Clostridium sporogenes]KEI87558.1 hypothetical protein N492_11365 [Clostridium botulinum B2 267]NFL76725.1 hypothetical protein [Clostridium sporogenes]